MKIRLISWNIWGGRYLPQILAYLKEVSADVILLQEAQENNSIARHLGYHEAYAFSMVYKNNGKEEKRGNAILTKFPILKTQIHVLSEVGKKTALEASVEIGKTHVTIFSIHLNPENQPGQIKKLMMIAPKAKTILAGDFNAEPLSIEISKKVFTHVGSKVKPTFCLYPDGKYDPLGARWVFDHIFISKDIHGKNFEVGNSNGSDHLPISATIIL